MKRVEESDPRRSCMGIHDLTHHRIPLSLVVLTEFTVILTQINVNLLLLGHTFGEPLQPIERHLLASPFPINPSEQNAPFRMITQFIVHEKAFGIVIISAEKAGIAGRERDYLIGRRNNDLITEQV